MAQSGLGAECPTISEAPQCEAGENDCPSDIVQQSSPSPSSSVPSTPPSSVPPTPPSSTPPSSSPSPAEISTPSPSGIPDINCEGSWSACTSACETAEQRTWNETVAQSGSGNECPAAPDCCCDGDWGEWSECKITDEYCVKVREFEHSLSPNRNSCNIMTYLYGIPSEYVTVNVNDEGEFDDITDIGLCSESECQSGTDQSWVESLHSADRAAAAQALEELRTEVVSIIDRGEYNPGVARWSGMDNRNLLGYFFPGVVAFEQSSWGSPVEFEGTGQSSPSDPYGLTEGVIELSD